MSDTVDRAKILAFRLAAHHLGERARPADILAITGACGVQDSPPGSAALALNARIEGLAQEHLAQCLQVDRTLIELWCMRGAPYLVPTSDAAVFTTGLLPGDESSCRYFIQGAAHHLSLFGIQAAEIVDLTARCLPQVLAERQLNKDQLGRELARCVEAFLPGDLHAQWRKPDGIGQNTYGESLVRYALYVVALKGLFCLAPKTGRAPATFILTTQWLGHNPPAMDARTARAGLVWRFLHCYGPDTPQGFARWAGVAEDYAITSFTLVEEDLADVKYEGRTLFLLRQDMPVLLNAARPRGVRLLPPGDPYLALQSKHMLLANEAQRKKVWKSSNNPGVLLVDGEIAAIWRPQKVRDRLLVRIEALAAPLSAGLSQEIEAEAARMAPFRQVRAVDVSVRCRPRI